MKPVIRLLLCAACSMSHRLADAQSVSAQRDGMRVTAKDLDKVGVVRRVTPHDV